VASKHRGHRDRLIRPGAVDKILLALILFAGGICASLFGTGADIVLYTLLVTRFRMDEKIATHQSIMVMAAISILGFGYRAFWDQGITDYQVRTWLCAYPVVLFMAPFGSYVLSKLKIDWMLRGIVVLNIFQMVYFNLKAPTPEKVMFSLGFSAVLFAVFWFTLAHMTRRRPVSETVAG
ncbi:MAG: sulfite exporter TauE/SafE family protein, partial [Phenylobacterium sp.]|nr:sulfite exporter TauE/SafE family protein [Phenylobacterium sp.]